MIFSDPEGRISDTPPQVSFLDHGFLFGDSIYEVVRVYNRKILGWAEHRERLFESARRMSLPMEGRLDEIETRMRDLFKKLNDPHPCLRMVITRGVGRLNINTKSCEKPLIYMAAWKYQPELFNQPVSLAIPKIRRNSKTALDPAIKSGNYLNSVLALLEAQNLSCDDALMVNPDGIMTELTTSNFGWIKGDRIFTPHEDAGILHGITRKIFMSAFSVEAVMSPPHVLLEADEVFVLSTFKEVLPVKSIRFEDGQIREFKDFSKSYRLRESFHEKILKKLEGEREYF